MISTLIRYRITMQKNRFATMPLAEKLAYALAGAVILAFVAVITAIFVDRADRVTGIVTPAVFPYFNYLCVLILNGLLMTAAFIEAVSEVDELYYRRETQFIAQFAHKYHKFFIFKLIDISVKTVPVLLLLFPFYLLYIFYFIKHHNLTAAVYFAAFSMLAAPIVLAFFASLTLFMAVIIARLLAFFRQRTLVLISVLGFIIAASVCLPALKSAQNEKPGADKSREIKMAYDRVRSATAGLDYLPASKLGEALTLAVGLDFAGAVRAAAWSLLLTLAAMLVSFYVSGILLMKDIGCLMDNITLRQGTAASLAYIWPMKALPPLWRGAAYDEIIHAMRKNTIIAFVIMIPAFFALPFYLPDKFFEAVSGIEGCWVIFAINCVILMYGSEIMIADIVSKRHSLQLLRSMPVDIESFMKAKAVFHSLIFTVMLLIAGGPWIYFMKLNAAELSGIVFLAALWSAAGSLLCHGAGCLAGGLFSMRKESDGLAPYDPASAITVFILLSVMCIGAFRLQKMGFSLIVIFAYLAVWMAASYCALVKGAALLEKKEL